MNEYVVSKPAKFSLPINVRKILAITFSLLAINHTQAATIDFEGLEDSISLTNQYASNDIIFSNATVLSSGISLNEFEFPPHSGANVAVDDNAPILLQLNKPFTDLRGYFTYSAPITITAYDETDSLLASINSAFSSNLAFSGDVGSAPNEFMQLNSAVPFVKVLIIGSPTGSSFALDDLSGTAVVPLPASIYLFTSALTGLLALNRKRRYDEINNKASIATAREESL